ncbi:hypothetical protein ACEUD7_08185 [Aeromonas veronii]
MSDDVLSEYRKKLDEDEGLQGKRKLLVILSVLVLAINFTGAVFKEANTFIFKIEFTNQSGLNTFLLLSILFLLMRYYAYAHSYHQELYELWSNRMLKNRNVFYYDKDAKIVRGLLGYAVTVWGEEAPGIEASKYHISGLFKRELLYPTYHRCEDGSIDEYQDVITLTDFKNDNWSRRKYLELLSLELKYQLSAFLKYRENLDLIGPYIIGVLAVFLTLYKMV